MEVIPFIGLGEVRFGTSRDKVHMVLNEHCELCQKRGLPGTQTEFCDSLGLFLYYKRNDELERVEALAGSNITYSGVPLVGRPLDELVNDLKTLGIECDRQEELYVFSELGCVTGDPGTGMCESTVVHDRESFDRYMQNQKRRREEMRAVKEEMQKRGPIKNPFGGVALAKRRETDGLCVPLALPVRF